MLSKCRMSYEMFRESKEIEQTKSMMMPGQIVLQYWTHWIESVKSNRHAMSSSKHTRVLTAKDKTVEVLC